MMAALDGCKAGWIASTASSWPIQNDDLSTAIYANFRDAIDALDFPIRNKTYPGPELVIRLQKGCLAVHIRESFLHHHGRFFSLNHTGILSRVILI